MPKYRTWIDPRAAVTRSQLNQCDIKDLGSKTMRWALHLSDKEIAYLEQHNADTLGRWDDPRIYNEEWKRFIDHPESQPYKVQRV